MPFNQFSLLKTQRFLPLFLTQFLGAFHDNLFKNALVVLILYALTSDSPVAPEILVTLATGVFILPFILFSAMGGQLADKYPKHLVIRKIKLAEIGIAFLGASALISGSITLSFIVLFALGTQSAFFGPSKYSTLPEHLEQQELIGGNALVNTGTFLAILIGTIAGTLLITMPAGKFVVGGGIIFVALAGYAISRKIPDMPAHADTLGVRLNPFTGVSANIRRTFGQSNDIVYAVLGVGWFYFLGALYLAQLPNYTKLVLGADEFVLAFFMTLFSVGVGIGGLMNNRLLGGQITARFAPLAALGIALFTADLFLASQPFAAVLATDLLINLRGFISSLTGLRIALDIFLIAVCGGLFVVPLLAIIQNRTNDDERARIVAGNAIINSVFILISAALSAALLSFGVTISQLFLACAAANIPVAFAFRHHNKQAPV